VRLSAWEIEARHVSGPVTLSLNLRLPSGAEKVFKLNPGETARV